MRRRIHRSRGFAMVDALVSLAVAALTLSLLTSASWGLKIASDRRASFEATAPADWLLARRTLQSWIGDASNDGPRASSANLFGTATTLRLLVRDASSSLDFVGEFRVEGTVDTGYTLIASRHDGLRDARVLSDTPRDSTLLMSSEPLRFLYLLPNGRGDAVWRYETGDGSTLPLAVGIEAGDTRHLTLPVFATLSQTCFAALGPGALEDDQCGVR